MKSRLAQGALEFALITTAMMLLTASVFIVAERNFQEIQEARYDEQVYSLLKVVETEVQLAFQGGIGYQRDFVLPKTLLGQPYAIELFLNESSTSRDELIITYQDEEFFSFLSFDVEGNITNGNMRAYGGSPVILQSIP